MKAIIYESELELIGRYAADFSSLETGGDLFGFWTHSGFPVIQVATGPGYLARRSATSFYQDAMYLRRIGAELRRCHGLQHIGEWHSHHRLGLDEPSGGDADTVVHAMDGSDLNQFFLTIVTLQRRVDSDVPSARGFLFRRTAGCSYASCGWVVLPGRSPMRDDPRVVAALDGAQPRSRPVACLAEPRTTLEAPCSTNVPLRPGSWATKPRGLPLLKAVKQQLAEMGEVCIGATPDGLIETSWSVDDTDWRLAFANDTSLASTAATLRWNGQSRTGELELRGSMAEVLAKVHANVETVVEEQKRPGFELTDDTVLELVSPPPAPPAPGRLIRHRESGVATKRQGTLTHPPWIALGKRIGRLRVSFNHAVSAVRKGFEEASGSQRRAQARCHLVTKHRAKP